MAHHQGMSIVALANVLLGGVAQRWGMAHPRSRPVGALLHERAPRELPRRAARPGLPLPMAARRAPDHVRTCARRAGAGAHAPAVQRPLQRHAAPNGAGWSRWGRPASPRWRDDALRDASGSFLYLRRRRRRAGVAHQPPGARPGGQLPVPVPHRPGVLRRQLARRCAPSTTVWVSPEDDIELRKVVLSTGSREPIELELISALEVTLASHAADEAHPAFSNLFVQADWLPRSRRCASSARRACRPNGTVQAAHFVAMPRARCWACAARPTASTGWAATTPPASRWRAADAGAPGPRR
jgi:cyclic beta-1,2-glucan synthetase